MANTAFTLENESTSRGAPAIGRAARILEAVADTAEPPGISALARSTGLGKSSVHALVSALTAEGLLAPAAAGGFVLGPRLAMLGERAREGYLLRRAETAVRRLAEETGETAFFGRLTGDRVTILVRGDGSGPLRLSAPVGSSVPLAAGALGGAFAASSHVATERNSYLPGIAAAAAMLTWADATYFLWTVGLEAGLADDDLARLAGAVARAADDLRPAPLDGSGGPLKGEER